MKAVSYALSIDGQAAPAEVLSAIQRIDVEDHASLADLMRLRLAIAVRPDGSAWQVLDDDLFPRLANLKLTVTLGSNVRAPLIDAYVIETSTRFSDQPGQSYLDVVAMDPTVLMNLEEKVRPWPDMADADIASSIFGEYGFAEKVETTQPSRSSNDVTTVQRGTDIQFLRQLAERNGYEVFVELDSSGQTEGHFHPPRLDEPPQGVLSVNMGEATNVSAFEGRDDMLRATTVAARGLEVEGRSESPVQSDSTSRSNLGTKPALAADRPRRVLLSQTGLASPGELQTLAQAVVDRSSWSLEAEGELITQTYGGVLRAKRPVSVRGAGRRLSGTWYVERVLHSFAGDRYTQKFTLRRNAVGLTGQESFVDDGALPS